MKTPMFVLATFVALPLAAQSSGPSATGTFQFSTPGGTKSISFDARLHTPTSAGGQITFTGTESTPDQDVDGAGDGDANGNTSVSITVAVDCLVVNGNHAAMSGKITASSPGHFVGRRAILAVEDNGEGINATTPDRFSWGLYRQQARTWTPSDAELPFDNGASFNWTATDAERPDDVGIPARRSETVDCHSFGFGSYTLDDVQHGNGNIQVRP